MEHYFTKKILFTLLYYFIAFGLTVAARNIDPTNLAGPGLDMLVYPIVLICCIFLFVRSFRGETNAKLLWITSSIHLLGLSGLIIMLFLPANRW